MCVRPVQSYDVRPNMKMRRQTIDFTSFECLRRHACQELFGCIDFVITRWRGGGGVKTLGEIGDYPSPLHSVESLLCRVFFFFIPKSSVSAKQLRLTIAGRFVGQILGAIYRHQPAQRGADQASLFTTEFLAVCREYNDWLTDFNTEETTDFHP